MGVHDLTQDNTLRRIQKDLENALPKTGARKIRWMREEDDWLRATQPSHGHGTWRDTVSTASAEAAGNGRAGAEP